jgi:GGDEF domain-containing protein
MMNLPAIYITNGTAVLLLSVIHFSSKRSLRHGMLDEKMFFGMYFFNFMQCIIETITFLLDGKPAYRTLSLVLNVILFSNSAILSYFWTIYADYKLFRDIKRIRRIYPFVAIPAVFIIVGCFINLVTPVFFALDHNNVYHRANLFIVTYAVTYFYLIYGVVLIYLYREKVHKRLFLPVSLFMIPVLIGSLLQSLFYGYSFIWLGMSIGLNSLFVNLQNEASYVDELSGLFNRQYLNNLLLMYGERKNIAGFPAAIVLDIDRFKSINDRLGILSAMMRSLQPERY